MHEQLRSIVMQSIQNFSVATTITCISEEYTQHVNNPNSYINILQQNISSINWNSVTLSVSITRSDFFYSNRVLVTLCKQPPQLQEYNTYKTEN